jgi:hypothetical protein
LASVLSLRRTTTVDYLSPPLRSCFGIISLLVSRPYTLHRTPPSRSASHPLASAFPILRYPRHQASVSPPTALDLYRQLYRDLLGIGFIPLHSPSPPQYPHYSTHHSASLLKTHKHSLRNTALLSYTANTSGRCS